MPLPVEPPDRFRTHTARDRLDRLFGFETDPFMQDWDLEHADAVRLTGFVNTYAKVDLADDDRFALMELIVASADDALRDNNMNDSLWISIREMLMVGSHLHASTIFSWSCVDATCDDECFPVTPRMREIWNDSFGDRGFMPAIPNGGEPTDATERRS